MSVRGANEVFLTSQMEPIYTRSVLPCIDEPARKAIFRLRDPFYNVWSNGEIERLCDNGRRSYFSPALKMFTYLLALIMAPKSDFACRSPR